jgi:hypothetical protein
MPAVNVQSQIMSQLEYISDTLDAWAQEYGGKCVIVSNLQDLWEQSSQSSQKPLLFLCWAGEEPLGDDLTRDLTHRVKRSWIVRVKQGRGFYSVRGQSVLQFSTAVETVRDKIRAMLGISEFYGNAYSGSKLVRLGDQVIDCYDISFSTYNDLPQILMSPDNSPN